MAGVVAVAVAGWVVAVGGSGAFVLVAVGGGGVEVAVGAGVAVSGADGASVSVGVAVSGAEGARVPVGVAVSGAAGTRVSVGVAVSSPPTEVGIAVGVAGGRGAQAASDKRATRAAHKNREKKFRFMVVFRSLRWFVGQV